MRDEQGLHEREQHKMNFRRVNNSAVLFSDTGAISALRYNRFLPVFLHLCLHFFIFGQLWVAIYIQRSLKFYPLLFNIFVLDNFSHLFPLCSCLRFGGRMFHLLYLDFPVVGTLQQSKEESYIWIKQETNLQKSIFQFIFHYIISMILWASIHIVHHFL